MREWRGVYWARWSYALTEAGFAPNQMRAKLDSSFIFEKLAAAARHCGKIPTLSELKLCRQVDSSCPGEWAFTQHSNDHATMLAEFRKWLATRPEYENVATMFPPVPEMSLLERRASVAEGFVYLIRSGTHYKIGRSDELERRVKEIRIALPDAAILVHSIRTDDPPGIKAYWHRRFADKRANGEWFKLTPADLAAFKRRKYQ